MKAAISGWQYALYSAFYRATHSYWVLQQGEATALPFKLFVYNPNC